MFWKFLKSLYLCVIKGCTMDKVYIVVAHEIGDSIYCHNIKGFFNKSKAQSYADRLNEISRTMFQRKDEWGEISHTLTLIEGQDTGDYERHLWSQSVDSFKEFIVTNNAVKSNPLIKKYSLNVLIEMYNFFETNEFINVHYEVEEVEFEN